VPATARLRAVSHAGAEAVAVNGAAHELPLLTLSLQVPLLTTLLLLLLVRMAHLPLLPPFLLLRRRAPMLLVLQLLHQPLEPQ
jgi:hypothetical protein